MSRANTLAAIAAALVILLAWLVYLLIASVSPAAAQTVPTPTPLPQVQAAQNAAQQADAKVNDLQNERAQTEARLAEINRNIESQQAAAQQAASDARIAAATQNAVESGAAIGRLEGALEQLSASYAGKDAIIADMAARNAEQAAQHITDTQQIDRLSLLLQQANSDKKIINDSYNALAAQKETNQQNEMVSNAIQLIVALAFLMVMIALAAFILSRRRPEAQHDDEPPDPPIDAPYTLTDDEEGEAQL